MEIYCSPVLWISDYFASGHSAVPLHLLKELADEKTRSDLESFPFCVWATVHTVGGDVAQLVRASDRHAADAGSIPPCSKGFFSQGQLSVQTLLRCPYTPVCSRMH